MYIAYRFASDAPCISALLKAGVIQLTTESKPTLKRGLLSAAWVDSILVGSLQLLDSLRLELYLDDFQRCAANRKDKVRKSKWLHLPATTIIQQAVSMSYLFIR